MDNNYPINSDFEKITNNVLEISRQVWKDDTTQYPITCRVRYLINEKKYYVFFYSFGDYANNVEIYDTEKVALDEFEYRLLKYKRSTQINYNLKKSKKISTIQ